MPRFDYLLFDVDGTLLDSAEDICGAVSAVLSLHLPQQLEFAYLKSFIGKHLQELWDEVLPGQTTEFYADLLQRYRSTYLGRCHSSTRIYPGVVEALQALPQPKSTATTKSTQTAANILTQFGLRDFFQHVQGTDGFPAKPAPDVILRAIEGLGADPARTLMIGDSVPDMLAAKAAGVATCAVLYGYGSAEALSATSPDFLINNPQLLTEITQL